MFLGNNGTFFKAIVLDLCFSFLFSLNAAMIYQNDLSVKLISHSRIFLDNSRQNSMFHVNITLLILELRQYLFIRIFYLWNWHWKDIYMKFVQSSNWCNLEIPSLVWVTLIYSYLKLLSTKVTDVIVSELFWNNRQWSVTSIYSRYILNLWCIVHTNLRSD